jgi:hypothetical protein
MLRSTECRSHLKRKPRGADSATLRRPVRNGCECFDAQLADFCIDRPAAAMVTRTASPLLVQSGHDFAVAVRGAAASIVPTTPVGYRRRASADDRSHPQPAGRPATALATAG